MPNTLKGVRVNGENYHFDHDYLDNNPLPTWHASDSGKTLAVNGQGELRWSSPSALIVDSVAGSLYEGEVPTYVNGNLEWRSPMPTYSCIDEPHVLVVDNVYDASADEYKDVCDWILLKTALGARFPEDVGKVLTLGWDGLEWVDPSTLLNNS